MKKPSKKASQKKAHAPVSRPRVESKRGVQPLGDRVLVRPFTEDEVKGTQNHFGIILPESVSKEKSAQGVVLAVGETKKVKVGDVVLFSKYSYDEVEWNNEDLYLLKEEHLLAIINK